MPANLNTLNYFAGGEPLPFAGNTAPSDALTYFANGEPLPSATETVAVSNAIALVSGSPTISVGGSVGGPPAGSLTLISGSPTLALAGSERFPAAVALVSGSPTISVLSSSFTMSVALVSGDPTLSLSGSSFTAAFALVSGNPTFALDESEVFTVAVTLVSGAPTFSFGANVPVPASVYLVSGPPTLDFEAELQPFAAVGLVSGDPTIALDVDEPPAAGVALVSAAPNTTLLARVAYPHTGPLAVTSVTPNEGGGLTAVVIRGTGFLGAVAVQFGGQFSYGWPGVPITVIDDTEVHAFAPPSPWYLASGDHDPETVHTVVFTLDGDPLGSPQTDADLYTFEAPPVVYSVFPISGTDRANTPVRIYGKNLQFAVNAIDLGGNAAGTGDYVSNAEGTSATFTLQTLNFAGRFNDAYELRLSNGAGFGGPNNPTFTVYPGTNITPPATTALDDALSGRYGPVAIRYRFEQRDRAFTFLADLTPAVAAEGATTSGDLGAGGGGGAACTINRDNTQPVPARVALTFGRPELLPESFTAADPATFNVAVWADIDVPGEGTVSLCRGLFHLDLPVVVEYASGDGTLNAEWHAEGAELSYILADRTTPVSYIVPAGSSYVGVIGGICRTFGLQEEISTIIGANYVLPVDVPFQAGATWLDVCNALLWGINYYPLQANRQGVMTSRRRQDPAAELPVVAYTTESEPRMLVPPTTLTPYVGSFSNQVSVAIDDPTRLATPALATNADPTSPLSVVSSGKLNFKAYTGTGSPSTKAVYNEVMAQTIADFEVRDEAAKAVRRQIEIAPDPRRYGREWVLLTIQTSEQLTLWRVVSEEYTCAPGGPHTLVVELVKPLVVT